jgi:hypothetical protein
MNNKGETILSTAIIPAQANVVNFLINVFPLGGVYDVRMTCEGGLKEITRNWIKTCTKNLIASLI